VVPELEVLAMTLKVGDKIWHFDQNRRKYANGLSSPDRDHMWHEVAITGETSRSWITSYGKVPKRGVVYGWALSRSGVEDDLWVSRNAFHIRAFVDSLAYRFNPDRSMVRLQLEKIADVAGIECK
jgi:hypothetical protein